MNIHRIYYPVLTLGPGRRLGIWTRGCHRQCPGCMSPELWVPSPSCEIRMDVLRQMLDRILQNRPVDGVTISGGEPLEQEAELMDLLAFLRSRSVADVLLYTGLTRAELGGRADLLTQSATVVCGPYIIERNDGQALRGSGNQEILFADERTRRRYAPLLAGPRAVQPVESARELFLIGILDRDGKREGGPYGAAER